MDIKFASLILGAYLLGSVPAAYLAAKWSRGIDIRHYGSGNVGFTNLFRFTSKRVAFSVLVFDLGKSISMVVASRLLGMNTTQQVTAGVAVVVGHSWPVFLRFNGGKGVLSTLGVALMLPSINSLVPWEIIVFLAISAVCLFGFGSLPVGTGAGVATMPLVSWGFSRPLALTLGFLVMFLLIVIRRLAAPRTSLTASVSRRQLIVNRLLFDRDIRDRQAWVSRVPPRKRNGEHEE